MFQLVEKELVETQEKIEQLTIKEDVCMTTECIKSGRSFAFVRYKFRFFIKFHETAIA